MAQGRSGIRGSRIGAGPMGETERGEPAARTVVSFWCGSGHHIRLNFSTEATIPETWDCPKCGLPAGPDPENAPLPVSSTPYKTHLAYVRERRSDADGEILLNEALARLRGKF
jgi:hypothetical protein